jgi:tetratricopeptide (TPR) repeat protein
MSKQRQKSDADTHGSATYKPAVDAHAMRLIARIKRDHRDTEAVLALQAHYEKHGDWPSLANLLEGWAQTLRDDRNAADALVKAAECVLKAPRDLVRAQALYLSALRRYPAHAEALTRIEALFRERGDDAELERVLQQVANELARRNADASLRAGVHYRLGQHYEHHLGLAGRAIAQYRAALELDRRLLPAITAAKSIYLASGKAPAVADMIELEVGAVSDMRVRHALLLSLARHHRDALSDLDAAVLAMRRALKALPGDAGTLELLADLLRERALRDRGESADADRSRAAELYYQVARSVPRKQARPRLIACLALHPSHPRAQRMLDELDGYGAAAQSDGEYGARSQAEVDRLPTGRYAAASDPRALAAVADALGITKDATEPPHEDDLEMAAWLEDAEVVLIDAEAHPRSMVPVTDRPPPPDASVDPTPDKARDIRR